jgi:hypothetical protein
MLLGYYYALRQQLKQLAKERIEIQKRRDSAIEASAACHRACSDASYTNNRRHHRHRSTFENLEYSERQSLSKNLDSSILSVDEQGNITKDTRSSTCGSSSISAHNTAKSRRPKGTYAPGSTTRMEDGRQQIVSKRRGSTPQ